MFKAPDCVAFLIIAAIISGLVMAHRAPAEDYIPPSKPFGLRTVIVEKVYDGDTFRTTTGEVVRLEGIDSPETAFERRPADFLGDASADLLRSLVEGATIELETGPNRTDKFGRTLAWVWSEDMLLNSVIVHAGLAIGRSSPPNVKYIQLVRDAELCAQRERRGIWNQ